MDAASQVPPGYGQLGTRAAARQSGSRRDLDWRYSSRIAGKPATEGGESRAGPGGRGETGPGNRAYSDGSDPGFQKHNASRFPETKCDGGVYPIHSPPQNLCGTARNWVLACD